MATNFDVTKVPFQPKQAEINWRTCTADEIIEYEGQGQTVPVAILKWAEEINKLENAPDDVTYEMVQGKTDINEINSLLALNSDNITSDTNEESENNLNQAQQERAGMQTAGASNIEIGEAFISKSQELEGSAAPVSGMLNQGIQSADAAVAAADAKTAAVADSTKAIKAEYDSIIQKIQGQTDAPDPADITRLSVLGQQLTQAGTEAQAVLLGYDGQLSAIRTQTTQHQQVLTDAQTWGQETTNIGLELIGEKAPEENTADSTAPNAEDVTRKTRGFNPFSLEFAVGISAIQQGKATTNVGVNGEETLDAAQATNTESMNRLNANKTKVQNSTYVAAAKSSDAGKTEEQGDDATGETPAEKEDPTLADETIVTDPNEILKRKERKGLT